METAGELQGKNWKNWKQIAKSFKHQLGRLSNSNEILCKENQMLRELSSERWISCFAEHDHLEVRLKAAKTTMAEQITVANCTEDLRACKAELSSALKETEKMRQALESQEKRHEADQAIHISNQARLQEEADQKMRDAEKDFAEALDDLQVELAAANAEKTRLIESLAKHRKEAQTLMASLGVPGSGESGPKRKYHMLTLDKRSS